MAEWFQRLLAGLSGRERLLVVAAITLGTAALIFFTLVEPLSTARHASALKLADRSELLEWLIARTVEVRALRGRLGDANPRPVAGAAGIAEVEASLGVYGLRSSLERLAPKPGGWFEARFEDVSYTALLTWLAESKQRLGVTVTEIVIEVTGRPGHVDAELKAALVGRQR